MKSNLNKKSREVGIIYIFTKYNKYIFTKIHNVDNRITKRTAILILL